MKKITYIMFSLIFIISQSGCNAQLNILPPDEQDSDLSAVPSEPSNISQSEDFADISSSYLSDVMFTNIYEEIVSDKKSGMYNFPVLFNSEKASYCGSYTEAKFVDIKNNTLLGVAGFAYSDIVTCDLVTGEWYKCRYYQGSGMDIRLWPNNVIGIIGYKEKDFTFASNHALLLDSRCEELSYQIQFDL